MGIYEHYRMWRLAEEYESSASRHFMLMALCIVIMGICLLVGCLWPTMIIITMCSFIGAFDDRRRPEAGKHRRYSKPQSDGDVERSFCHQT